MELLAPTETTKSHSKIYKACSQGKPKENLPNLI